MSPDGERRAAVLYVLVLVVLIVALGHGIAEGQREPPPHPGRPGSATVQEERRP